MTILTTYPPDPLSVGQIAFVIIFVVGGYGLYLMRHKPGFSAVWKFDDFFGSDCWYGFVQQLERKK